MIEIKKLNKSFGRNKVLDNISLHVSRGEILGFLGPNGAGKTTTMKIITGFWAPSSGSVEIGGLDVQTNSLATREKIGYLPETVPLYDDMRVYEYLKFIAEIRNIAKENIKARIKEVIGDCGLSRVLRKPIDELSKGFRQRVGLAQAIMHKPDILILDEPTTGLDPNQIAEIRDLIRKIGQEKTVIFSTHILSEVSATCDRAVIINKGKIVIEGSPEELANKGGAKNIVYAKIRGPKDEIIREIEARADVASIEVKDKESDDIYGYQIKPTDSQDLREDLSRLLALKGWSILELKAEKASLENVFKELTK